MEDEIKKPSFLVYYDNEVIVLRLPDREAGKLFKSLFPYGKERIKPNFDANPALASGAWVDFSQGCDIRIMTQEKAEYIKRMKIKRIHFA